MAGTRTDMKLQEPIKLKSRLFISDCFQDITGLVQDTNQLHVQ